MSPDRLDLIDPAFSMRFNGGRFASVCCLQAAPLPILRTTLMTLYNGQLVIMTL